MNIIKKSLLVVVMVLLPTLIIAQQPQRELSLREKLTSLTYTPAVKELARDRRRASLAGMFLGQRNRTVGYHPIISVLPQGHSMVAGPVILSPDRRYARIGISYSSMSIGAVHTFNFSTGKYQTLESK
jgi:hypothetical protein